MKINEVETLVGITKKNIRFYEEQGLVTPHRNSENGYRDYGEDEVSVLRRIKLLRKLGIPILEIRKMQSGGQTVGDAMRRHLITLEREQRNLEQSTLFCQRLKERSIPFDLLDAETLLGEMEQMECEGTTFQNKQEHDILTRYVAPVVVSILISALMVTLIVLALLAYWAEPDIPLPALVAVLCIPAAVIVGVLLTLAGRIREIQKGEMDDAKRY